ncbi:MAG TPA: hypothetical protein VN736_29385 [Candidatus Limnocylindrales bacterium]|nr:hypothetical protein [Candidatus Limnocylindrales bacterium]
MVTDVSIYSIPTNAIAVPNGGIVPDYQQNWIDALDRMANLNNTKSAIGYQGQVQIWTENATHCRELGTALPAKPVPSLAKVLNVSASDDAGTKYVWYTDGDPVGPPCPDLPPLPQVIPNHLSVGPNRGGAFYLCNSDDTMPVGFNAEVTDGEFPGVPAGKYSKVGSMMPNVNWYFKFAAFLLCFLFAVPNMRAQVSLKLTYESMAVPMSQIATARNLLRVEVEGCNVGATPYTLTPERISIAAPAISFIDTDDAAMTLNSQASKTPWGRIKQWGPVAASIAALVLTHAKTISGSTGAMITIGASEGLPLLQSVANQAAPSAQTLLAVKQYPLILQPSGQPGDCFTDHRFASRVPKGGTAPVVVVVGGK